jgi:hypothetical protein
MYNTMNNNLLTPIKQIFITMVNKMKNKLIIYHEQKINTA